MGEVLPYLEVKKDNEKEEDKKKEVKVPNIVGMSFEQAEKTLKEYNLGISLDTEVKPDELDKKEVIIKEQLPKSGISIYEGTNVYVTI